MLMLMLGYLGEEKERKLVDMTFQIATQSM
jgi:hypothetical protein